MTQVEKIQKALDDNEVYVSEIHETVKSVSLVINWGDWKHSHQAADEVMAELGYVLDDEIVLEENGSDCYSSEHFYSKTA